jgi:hypothetical protein
MMSMYSKGQFYSLEVICCERAAAGKKKWISGWLMPKNGRGSDYRAIMGANH